MDDCTCVILFKKSILRKVNSEVIGLFRSVFSEQPELLNPALTGDFRKSHISFYTKHNQVRQYLLALSIYFPNKKIEGAYWLHAGQVFGKFENIGKSYAYKNGECIEEEELSGDIDLTEYFLKYFEFEMVDFMLKDLVPPLQLVKKHYKHQSCVLLDFGDTKEANEKTEEIDQNFDVNISGHPSYKFLAVSSSNIAEIIAVRSTYYDELVWTYHKWKIKAQD